MVGPGVANLGHAYPKLVEAIMVQAGQLITCPESYYNDRRAELMAKLGSLLPGSEHVFLCNSGTEAVEAALKFACVSTSQTKFIAAIGGFHGGQWARFQPPGISATGNCSNRWFPGSRTCPITTRQL